MQIKTKFDINLTNEVFYMEEGKIKKDTVTGIRISVYYNSSMELTIKEVYIFKKIEKKSDELFKSPKELADSLVDSFNSEDNNE